MNQLSHETIANYLLASYSDQTPTDPTDIVAQDPALEGLVTIVRRTASEISAADLSADKAEKSVTLSAIEELLMDIYAGTFNKDQVSVFLSSVIYCPDFYGKAYIKLHQIYTMVHPDPVSKELLSEIEDPEFFLEKIAVGEPVNSSLPMPQTRRWYRSPYIRSAAAVFVLSLSALFAHRIFTSQADTPAEKFIVVAEAGKEVFYDPEQSDLRGSRNEYDGREPYLRNVENRYNSGFHAYLISDFDRSIGILKGLLVDMDQLDLDTSDLTLTKFKRDATLLVGLSHLHVSQQENLLSNEKSENLDAAAGYISAAKQLTEKNQLKTDRAEAYFLGLTNYFQGYLELAEKQFMIIDNESPFYNASQAMLEIL